MGQIRVHLRLNAYERDRRAWDAAYDRSAPVGSVGRPVGQSLRKLTGDGDSSLGDDDQRDVMNVPLCVGRAWDAATATISVRDALVNLIRVLGFSRVANIHRKNIVDRVSMQPQPW